MTTLPEGVLDVMKSNLNFHYLDCPLADLRTSDISRYFDKTYDFIENANTPVLVHCYAGISRSATIVLAYLMRKNQWTLEQAFRYVRERRPIIYPNIGFLNALKMYEIEIMTK
jgi:protein-tyrosine phosphatase